MLPSQIHDRLEEIFRVFLPQHGMAVREEQLSLSHAMLDALFQNRIALCDAGVGIGKTYAYLIACILWQKASVNPQPIVISTSSVALQQAIVQEYLPFLSQVFVENKLISRPVRATIRKGKERFVCDQRLGIRLHAIRDKKKNAEQKKALFSLRTTVDLDTVPELSGFDRRQVRVPKYCPRSCPRQNLCRYHCYLAKSWDADILICNHNYLLADAIHRTQGLPPLLRDFGILVVDEAHKLPEAAIQMYGKAFSMEDAHDLCTLLVEDSCSYTALQLQGQFDHLFATLKKQEADRERIPFQLTPERKRALCSILSMCTRLKKRDTVSRWFVHRLEQAEQILHLFYDGNQRYILFVRYDKEGVPTLCAASRKIPTELGQALWERKLPMLLTSGTLLAGNRFDRTRQVMGLWEKERVSTFSVASPFPYEQNCLLYLPDCAIKFQMSSEQEAAYLAGQIVRLVRACWGHTLVLFTSYALMGTVSRQIKDLLPFPLLTVWRNSQEIVRQFKDMRNAVLFAAGSCWEGVDFPGDMVSSLILVRLPFPISDPLSEAEREQYASLQEYIQAVILPEMQKKLRQGFGRAIRTETDTCVISVLDYRAVPGGRYHQAMMDALPTMPVTQSIQDVEAFIREKKSPEYFTAERNASRSDDLPAGQA